MEEFINRLNKLLYGWKDGTLGFVSAISVITVIVAVFHLIYRYGFILTQLEIDNVYSNLDIIFFIFALVYLIRLLFAIQRIDYLKRTWFECVLIMFILANGVANKVFDLKIILYYLELFSVEHSIKSYQDILSLYLTVLIGLELIKISTRISDLNFKPAATFIFSFIILILIGTALLMLPAMTYGTPDMSYRDSMPFLDALFTSVSASCVTGLAVVDTGTYFTFKGQLVIMFLIQLGGIGIVSFATFFATFLAKGVGIKHQSIIQDFLSSESLISAKALLRKVIFITISIEFIGFILIFFSWDESLHFRSLGQKVFFSLFHSISAFCNAGFSLFSDGLYTDMLASDTPLFDGDGDRDVSVKKMYLLHFVIAILIVLGGIGFGTIEDVLSPSKIKDRLIHPWKDLKISSRIALQTTLWLILIGTVGFMVLESHQLRDRTIVEALNTSFFQSVTCRTAGFNTMDFSINSDDGSSEDFTGGLQKPTIILCIFLMFIGACPGSTGGGIKSSTFFLIARSSFASIKGQERIEIGRRTIPNDLVRKAYSIFMFATTYNIIAIFILTITEADKDILAIVFEQVSAFATAGLSTGITSDLSSIGKIIIIISMYIGRVGTLTLALALSNKVITNSYRYPDGHVMVG
ncbi:MAG: TrkH family potassium uptake protein [Flammeovirgaceae bacterium]